MKKNLVITIFALVAIIAVGHYFFKPRTYRSAKSVTTDGSVDVATSSPSISPANIGSKAQSVASASSTPPSSNENNSATPSRSLDAAAKNPIAKAPILLASAAPMPTQSPSAEEIAALFADAKTPADLLKNADLSNPAIRAYVVARMSEMQEAKRESVLEKADRLGLPIRKEGPGNKVSIIYDFDGDRPIYRSTDNLNAAISSGANQLRDQGTPYGLDGTNMKAAVWDEAKIRNTHQEFATNRIAIKDSASTFSDHSTHVGGTIGATGVVARAKGMAPKVTIDSYDWNSDYTEMTAAGAATATETGKIPVSNHSYGAGFDTAAEYVPYMGRYEDEARTTDTLAASLPYYLIFWAAGNEQDFLTTLGGYQSITFNGLAKNIITIGAADDAVTNSARDVSKGTLAYFSSEGPCDDGRIKPDIVANGVGVYSSISTSNTAYDTYDGTSMATPNAVGSSILLEQLYGREFSGQRLRASMLKALLIETADDLGRPGPDYQYGWGYINVKAAADVILAQKATPASPKMFEDQLTNTTKTRTHTFQWDGTSPIRATLCWTDPAGAIQANDSRTPNLVHNLNLKITAPNGTTQYLPYVMPFVGTWTQASMSLDATTGVNNVDNVEQVFIATPSQAGTYTMSVSVSANLTTTIQAYSLVITGGANVASNPPPSVTLDSPTTGSVILPNTSVTLNASATDKVIGGAAGIVSSVQFYNGTTLLGTDTVAPYSLNWTPSDPGTYALTAVATDSEMAAAISNTVNLTVLSGNGVPTISSFTPTSGSSGDIVTITGTNFAGISSVKFNNLDAVYTVTSTTSISATAPAGATTGVLTVTNSYGSATSSGSFTIVQNPVLISQVYGAGGNSGATYNADYVELYNRGETTVSLVGWSVQYASASGTSWATASLAGSIAPGKYYLVKLAGGSNGTALPTADAAATSINMSGSNGKVALRNTTTAFSGASPIGAIGLQDFVGFGSATAYEGTASAPSPSSTTAIFRAGGGANDSGNNATDFTAATPNPRNSSTGAASAPVISSSTTASGIVGQAFSYQIVASNTPSSYAATNLPANLSIDTTTGLISGTPSAAGTSTVNLSATNGTGTGTATLTMTITAGGGASIIFSENMGTPSGTTTIASNTFQNSGTLTFTGTGDARSTTASTGYTAASGSGNVFLTNTAGINFQISGINTVGYSGLSLSFGHYKSTTAANNEMVAEVSTDGTTYTALTYTRPTGAGTQTWLKITPTGTIPATANLRIRFRQTSTTSQFRVDDVILSGTAAASPAITTSGALAAVNTTYGSPSPTPTSFTVGGTNMTAGILITPPSGFEVSQSAGGTSGYSATQTIGSSGSIANTTIYLRLAATTPASSYSGNVVCSSAGATSVNLPVVNSVVAQKSLTVTAQNRTKVFGSTLNLGTTAFNSSGLVNSETIGGVTLTASGGIGANDAVANYQITASNASGGTFNASNYSISYLPGTLSVTALTFAEWSAGLADSSAAGDSDHDGTSNLMEYFLGLNPASADVALPIITISGSEIQLDYRRSKGITNIAGQVEWTSNLGSTVWTSDNVTDTLLNDLGAYEIRRAVLPVQNGDTAKFLRLHVTMP